MNFKYCKGLFYIDFFMHQCSFDSAMFMLKIKYMQSTVFGRCMYVRIYMHIKTDTSISSMHRSAQVTSKQSPGSQITFAQVPYRFIEPVLLVQLLR